MKRLIRYVKGLNLHAWLIFFLAIYGVLVIKLATLESLNNNILFATYSLAVSFYILSRFGISHFHSHKEARYNASYEPTLTFGIPCKNEEENIAETILRIAKIDYPKHKFNIVAINDGSEDGTLQEMKKAAKTAKTLGVDVVIVDWKVNRGKREGMAECIRKSQNEVIVFIDSDSFIEPRTPRELVKYFTDSTVGAVAGHAYVANADKNLVTKMQAVRYYVAFKAYKASESMFDAVTCCSGCCSAYRREYLLPVLEDWLHQKFLGITCTYGDDRSLTNFLLEKGYKAMYAEKAVSHTFVPDSFKKFMKQQLRWKKSWVRESIRAGKFMWRKHPVMSIAYYLGIILPILAPLIVIRALIWFPLTTGKLPWFYVGGLLLMSCIYGLYYRIYHKDRKWIYGAVFAVFYTIVLIWQLPYAILTLRDPKWGTR